MQRQQHSGVHLHRRSHERAARLQMFHLSILKTVHHGAGRGPSVGDLIAQYKQDGGKQLRDARALMPQSLHEIANPRKQSSRMTGNVSSHRVAQAPASATPAETPCKAQKLNKSTTNVSAGTGSLTPGIRRSAVSEQVKSDNAPRVTTQHIQARKPMAAPEQVVPRMHSPAAAHRPVDAVSRSNEAGQLTEKQKAAVASFFARRPGQVTEQQKTTVDNCFARRAAAAAPEAEDDYLHVDTTPVKIDQAKPRQKDDASTPKGRNDRPAAEANLTATTQQRTAYQSGKAMQPLQPARPTMPTISQPARPIMPAGFQSSRPTKPSPLRPTRPAMPTISQPATPRTPMYLQSSSPIVPVSAERLPLKWSLKATDVPFGSAKIYCVKHGHHPGFYFDMSTAWAQMKNFEGTQFDEFPQEDDVKLTSGNLEWAVQEAVVYMNMWGSTCSPHCSCKASDRGVPSTPVMREPAASVPAKHNAADMMPAPPVRSHAAPLTMREPQAPITAGRNAANMMPAPPIRSYALEAKAFVSPPQQTPQAPSRAPSTTSSRHVDRTPEQNMPRSESPQGAYMTDASDLFVTPVRATPQKVVASVTPTASSPAPTEDSLGSGPRRWSLRLADIPTVSKKIHVLYRGAQPGFYYNQTEVNMQKKGFRGFVLKVFPEGKGSATWLSQHNRAQAVRDAVAFMNHDNVSCTYDCRGKCRVRASGSGALPEIEPKVEQDIMVHEESFAEQSVQGSVSERHDIPRHPSNGGESKSVSAVESNTGHQVKKATMPSVQGSASDASQKPPSQQSNDADDAVALVEKDGKLSYYNNLEFNRKHANVRREATARRQQELQTVARDGNDEFAAPLLKVMERFEQHDEGQRAVLGDEWYSKTGTYALPFPHGSGFSSVTLVEWLSLRPVESDAAWYTDTTLSNAVITGRDSFLQGHFFCSATTIYRWYPVSREGLQKLAEMQVAIRSFRQSGGLAAHGLCWPCLAMPHDTKKVVLPWNTGFHWIAVAITPNFETRVGKIEVFDSLAGRDTKLLQRILPVFADMIGLQYAWEQTWVVVIRDTMKQNNWVDCGPLAAHNCRKLLSGENPSDDVYNLVGVDKFCRKLRFDLLKAMYSLFFNEEIDEPRSYNSVGELTIVGNSTSRRQLICNVLSAAATPMTADAVTEAIVRNRGSPLGPHDTLQEEVTILLCLTPAMFGLVDDTKWKIRSDQASSVAKATSDVHLKRDPEKDWQLTTLDPIDRPFDLYIVIIRTSAYVSRKSANNNHDVRPRELLEAYWHRFGQTQDLPQQYVYEDDLDLNVPIWHPYFREAKSSRKSVVHGTTAEVAEVRRIFQVANDKALEVEGRRPRVLLLGNGFDGLTSNNDTWAELTEAYPELDFSISLSLPRSMCPPGLFRDVGGDDRYGLNTWAHYEVKLLAAAWSKVSKFALADRTPSSWKAHHEQSVFICLLIDCKKLDHSLWYRRKIWPIEIEPAEENPRAVRLLDNRNQQDLERLADRECGVCGTDTSERWYRFHADTLDVMCTDCLPEVECSKNTAAAEEENRETPSRQSSPALSLAANDDDIFANIQQSERLVTAAVLRARIKNGRRANDEFVVESDDDGEDME
ncbi:unnamed protein product [Zymoseptoria tritici ST99CH_1A5]|uniref:Ubiquitin-like protease family profile domain-containing protein n=1 Tax=Zymoseptoria tritici ST99CH_1A5 TaxID=1276529 RepID=A0A1Y6LZX1_ZYMTR|nr:unnamed protein product [Zymoseptoria tritici ST99CH_1A5]